MQFWDWILLIAGIIAVLGVGLYFLNRWASKKVSTQEDIIARTKQSATIFVIEKKKEKPINANLPKQVLEQLPKYLRNMKQPLVRVKIGPQIMTMMCDKKVFNALQEKKNAKVEIAGIYILSMKGMKTNEELKEIKRAKKEREKLAAKSK